MAEAQLALLMKVLGLLDQYAKTVTRQALESNLETWLLTKAALETAAQCSIDVATELVTRRGIGLPETYRESFLALAQAGLIRPELATALAKWAGLRNILVHMYTVLDLDEIHRALGDTAVLREFHARASELLR